LKSYVRSPPWLENLEMTEHDAHDIEKYISSTDITKWQKHNYKNIGNLIIQIHAISATRS